MTDPSELVVFLGGYDLEMLVIGRMVRRALGPTHVVDRQLGWGAKASAYAAEISATLAAGKVPVLIELTATEAEQARWADAIWVDHHGPRAGEPTSLEQVHRLLGQAAPRWSRWHTLVAANDRGHVRAMRAAGATLGQMRRVRAADRCAQGITAEEEAAGAAALARAERLCSGRLLLVRLPHGRTATVADRLALADASVTGADAAPTLLVVSPGEINAFGPGAAIEALVKAFPDGWWGGDLPDVGFWGATQTAADETAALAILKQLLG